MDKELELKLVEKYPKIFEGYGGNPKKTAMAWGMSCGNGWYNLIDNLCRDIAEICKDSGEVVALQVKEKFGGLRFYYGSDNLSEDQSVKIYKRIEQAETESFKTCESCGEPGRTREGGWLRTLCDNCQKGRNLKP